jgi:hypothetical protein
MHSDNLKNNYSLLFQLFQFATSDFNIDPSAGDFVIRKVYKEIG